MRKITREEMIWNEAQMFAHNLLAKDWSGWDWADLPRDVREQFTALISADIPRAAYEREAARAAVSDSDPGDESATAEKIVFECECKYAKYGVPGVSFKKSRGVFVVYRTGGTKADSRQVARFKNLEDARRAAYELNRPVG